MREFTREHKVPHPLNLIAMLLSCIRDLIEYGHFYLNKEEYELKVREALNYYYSFLAASIIERKGKDFWDYHRSRLNELGCPLSTWKLLGAGVAKFFREIANPAQAVGKFRMHLGRKL